MSDWFWIGLSDSASEGTWLWLNGNRANPDDGSLWRPGYPQIGSSGNSFDCAVAFFGPGHLDFGPGHLDFGPGHLDFGPGHLDFGPGHLDFGPGHLDFGPGHLDFGPGHLDFGPGHLDFGPGHLDFGPGHLDFGPNHLDGLFVYDGSCSINRRALCEKPV